MHDIKWIRDNPDAFDAALKRRGVDVHLVSAATGEGLQELLDATVRTLDSAPMPVPLEGDVNPLGTRNSSLGTRNSVSPPRLPDERELDAQARAVRAPAAKRPKKPARSRRT